MADYLITLMDLFSIQEECSSIGIGCISTCGRPVQHKTKNVLDGWISETQAILGRVVSAFMLRFPQPLLLIARHSTL